MPPNLRFYDLQPRSQSLLDAVVKGFSAERKSLPPKFFYDKAGSKLFDAICETPEYYPTRTEVGLLRKHAAEIAESIGSGCWLIEPGSGSSRKVRWLLHPLRPAAYLPLDISGDYLRLAASELAAEYPWLDVHAVCADFASKGFELPALPDLSQSRAVFFPGSSIGNFEPQAAARFLRGIASVVGVGGSLLIGVDLKKDPAILNRAYNDLAGVTGAFNLNLLTRINREAQGHFDPTSFEHMAFYNEDLGRIEMHLVSRSRQSVRVNGRVFDFADGETIHTENSYKYTVTEFRALAEGAGFLAGPVWTDAREWFSLQSFRVGA